MDGRPRDCPIGGKVVDRRLLRRIAQRQSGNGGPVALCVRLRRVFSGLFGLDGQGLGTALYLLRTNIFHMSGDPPPVSRGIFKASGAVAVKLVSRFVQAPGSGGDGALMGGVHVWEIDVDGLRAWDVLVIGLAHHDLGVTKLEFTVHEGSVGTVVPEEELCSKDILQELHGALTLGHGQVRGQGVIAIRNRFYHRIFLAVMDADCRVHGGPSGVEPLSAHRLQGKSIESFMAKTETAVLGGGCFWCVEAALLQLDGVLSVESGYMGGKSEKPTYEQVCGGNTGHVEVVRVEFDPAVLSFGELLEVFFTAHDPTTLNRQGNDSGTQYRSVIFVQDEAQRAEAERVIAELTKNQIFSAPIVTAIEPAGTFWKAEDYHQNYFANNSHRPYCLFAIAPKVAKVRAKYATRVKRAG